MKLKNTLAAVGISIGFALGVGVVPADAAVPYAALSINEHYYPSQGAQFQLKYLYMDCDTVGYRYTATQPLYSSSINFFPASTTPKCNSVWVQSNGGTVAEQCTNVRYNPIWNLPTFANDNVRSFGVRYRSGCALNR